MRIPATAIVAALAMCNNQAIAASPSPAPQYSAEEAHAGCIRTDLRPCMISIGAALWFDMNVVAPEIAKRNELDVNGKSVRRTISISAAAPGHIIDRIGIILTLAAPAPNDTVVKAEVWLPADPEVAHTPSQYDKTYVYDAVAPLLGNRCPGLDRPTLYRFFENTVKPRETSKTVVQKRGFLNHTIATNDAEKVPFCGVSFSFHRHAEWNGTPDDPNLRSSLRLATYIDLE
jgi:hypothetical protein